MVKVKKTKEKKIIIDRKVHNIDAEGKVLGRLASEIAVLLMGKNKASYMTYIDMGDNVNVKNASKLKFTGKKMEQKKYHHHSGYPGGLKTKTLSELFEKDPSDVLKRAIYSMLPKNKLRNGRMKRLNIQN